MMPSETHEFPFEGALWRPINVQADGSCEPPPKTKSHDRLWVKMAYHLGSRTYNVVNLTQLYQCFVRLGYREGYMKGPIAMCNHPDCIKWQHTQASQRSPCKHIRAAVKWHVKLIRRLRYLNLGAENTQIVDNWVKERYGL